MRTARGSIKGMADTYWIADRKTGSSVATQLVDFSEKTFHENSTTDGILSGSYLTLGRPNVTSKATDEISNLLTLSILLVDNRTVITKQYDIAPRAAINNETKEVEVVLGTKIDPDKEEDSRGYSVGATKRGAGKEWRRRGIRCDSRQLGR